MLRPYQQRAIDQLLGWFEHNPTGNPCLVLPTGAGKSHIIAAFVKHAVKSWPDTRVLMLTHVKELIEQNAEKMRQHWPNAPLGIYSASLNRRHIDQITFGGVQSLRNRATQIGHVDLVIVDECHLISHKDEGAYRSLIADLAAINPRLRVIGLTATPFRLGHGYIHVGDDVLFNALVEPVTIEELINDGYLAPLRSKLTAVKLSTDGVHRRGGEFIESELQAAVNKPELNHGIVSEVIKRGADRKSWLFFCTGIEHAQAVTDELRQHDITAECVTGDTPQGQRADILKRFKLGDIRAVVNVAVLTTGFDAPNIDLIAMLRPTESPALYIQMVGRGLRLKEHCTDCLVLDFAGNVSKHGAIVAVAPPDQKQENPRLCPECDEILPPKAKHCYACGFEFPVVEREPTERKEKELYLRQDDIMGGEQEMFVSEVAWSLHKSRTSGKTTLKARYYGGIADEPIDHYLGVFDYDEKPFYQRKCRQFVSKYLEKSGVSLEWDGLNQFEGLPHILNALQNASHQPAAVTYKRNGKFNNVINIIWE